MTRQLRARTSRPNYATLAGLEDEDGAGPSNATYGFESDGSGSDFTPDAAHVEQEDHDDAEVDIALDVGELDDDADESAAPAKKKRGGAVSARELSFADFESASVGPRRGGTASRAAPKRTVSIPGSTYQSTKQSASSMLPSLNHRHRSVALHKRSGKTERLVREPLPLVTEETTLANAWGSSPVISERVNKSWGYNVGPGPLWEIVEDRGWFKEAYDTPRTTEKEMRPRVHEGVPLGGYEILNEHDSIRYTPHDAPAAKEESHKPSPPVACSFGPFGKQTRLELQTFTSIKMEQFFPSSKAHVFNAGGPVWGLDWCPIHPDERAQKQNRQYLAVSPFPTRAHTPTIGVRARRPSPACIQIWSLGPSKSTNAMDVDDAESDADSSDGPGEMCCEMVLCVDSGPALELKWCPLPCNDNSGGTEKVPQKLGILAGTFEDGSAEFYAVPDPTTLEKPEGHDEKAPLHVKLAKPLLRIELEDTCCWALDWANSEVIAIGCTNGNIAVYNVAEAFNSGQTNGFPALLPTHYFTAHQSAIRGLAWARAPVHDSNGEETADDPTVIVSGGYDGVECVTDIRDMICNVLNRTRDVVTAMCFSSYTGTATTIDHEIMIKAYSLSPTMLGRGHTILEPNGPVWSLSASDYHPQLAMGVADGSCLTTNTLKSTRRGGLVPPLEHKIYQLDYSRALGEYRMLEQFLPKEIHTRQTKSGPAPPSSSGAAGAWPPEVGVHRVAWNAGNGLARAGLLASATGAGLCRVDWLRGRWARDPPPYNGVEGMRGEGGTFDEDEDDESD